MRHDPHDTLRAGVSASTQGVCVSIAEGGLISGPAALPPRPSFYVTKKQADPHDPLAFWRGVGIECCQLQRLPSRFSLLNGKPLRLQPLIYQWFKRVMRVYEGFRSFCLWVAFFPCDGKRAEIPQQPHSVTLPPTKEASGTLRLFP